MEDDQARRIAAYASEVHGLDARDVLLVADSTGRFQNASHEAGAKPSHAILREWFFTVVPPEYKRKADGSRGAPYNGDVDDSLARFYDVCEDGKLLVAPTEEWLIESLRRCKLKRKAGGGIRLDDSKPGYSHAVDCCRYVTWYLEPRRGPRPAGGIDIPTFDKIFQAVRRT
jgi:hypothetical protein